MFSRSELETEPCTQLQRSRAAGAEYLGGTLGRLAEREGLPTAHGVERIVGAGQVGDVEQIEHLGEKREPVAFFPAEALSQPDILSAEGIAQSVAGRENQLGDDRPARIPRACRIALVPCCHCGGPTVPVSVSRLACT